jgi:hypothetical protein
METKTYIGKVDKSFIEDEVREITIEEVENNPMDSRQILPPGMDANPIQDDQGVSITLVDSNGKTVCIGVIPDPKVEPGEMKIYSRVAGGTIKAQVYCKKDGLIAIKNDVHDLKTLMADLITELKALKTIGSPTNHTVDPSSQALLDAWKAKFDLLFTDA